MHGLNVGTNHCYSSLLASLLAIEASALWHRGLSPPHHERCKATELWGEAGFKRCNFPSYSSVTGLWFR